MIEKMTKTKKMKEIISGMKKKNEKYKNGIILSIPILIVLFYFVTVSSATYERIMPNDGLIAPWHPGAYCISCHYSLMPLDKAQSISYTCKCHDYRPKGDIGSYNINMSIIYDIHKDIICIRCHIGMKNQDNVTAADFHKIMPIACTNCHSYINGIIQVPDKKNCSDCHANGNPHVVHGNKTEVICVACHGEDFANKYINKTIVITETNVSVSMKPTTTVEYPTITDIIRKILALIIPNA